MAQNISLLGANYADVPAVNLPKTGGGTARFDDTSTNNGAAASDIANGKEAWVNGAKVIGTGSSAVLGPLTVTPSTILQEFHPDLSNLDGYDYVAVNPIPSQYIVPTGSMNITANGTYDVAYLAEVVVNVPAQTGKNVQAYRGYDTVSTTSYTATDVTITVAKTGTYNVSWMGFRSYNSGTFGSQLYRTRGGTTSGVGSASTSFINTYGHSVSLTNQSFQQGDILTVRARAGTTSRYMGVGNLIIEEV